MEEIQTSFGRAAKLIDFSKTLIGIESGKLAITELYSHVPFVQLLREKKLAFILVAKPTDHKALYEDPI